VGLAGHLQKVESIWVDRGDGVVLIKARQIGGGRHEGDRSCFFRRLDADGSSLEIAARPVFDAAAVYGRAAGHTSEPDNG
jgi:phosphoribosyl-AMP cyclohydrolase